MSADLVVWDFSTVPDHFTGIDVRIREVCLRIKNPAIMVTGFSPNKSAITTSARHVVHQITLPSGERYALDLTAAQYGWYGPAVMPWHMFEVERLDGSLKTSGMGETAKELQNEVHGLGLDRKYEHEMTDLMTKCFNMCLAKWEQKKMPLKALLRLPEEAFTGEQDSLLDFMEWHVSAVKAEINERIAMAN